MSRTPAADVSAPAMVAELAAGTADPGDAPVRGPAGADYPGDGGSRVVAFSGHTDPVIVMETLDSGAHAYVSKDEGRDHLVEAVLAAATDRPYVTRSQARAMLADQRPARPALSEQEQQALLLWFQAMSKASVGRRMSISENTVRQLTRRSPRPTAGRAPRP